MTEQEWLECHDMETLLQFVRGKASKRKLRLLACGIARRESHFLTDARSQQAIDAAEKYADGLLTELNLRDVCREAEMAWEDTSERFCAAFIAARGKYRKHIKAAMPEVAAAKAATVCVQADLLRELQKWDVHICGDGQYEAEAAYLCYSLFHELFDKQVDLLCDIFGNPFRLVTVDPTWLTPDVAALAQTIYDERRFAELPILADALEEAGCTSEEMLSHCRDGGEHARGCWVIDLLLAKE